MATQTTGTSTLSTQLQTFYDRNLLSRLLPSLVYLIFGQPKGMPKNAGQTVNFRRFSSLAAATTPLTEGVTPTGDQLTITQLTASPLQYGNFVAVSDILDMTAIDPILMETGELLGEQAALTIDTVVRDILKAGTTVQFCGTGNTQTSHVATTDLITHLEIRKAVRTMQDNNVRRLTSIVNPSTGVGTKPIAASYVGIVSPSTLFDLKGVTGWVPVHEYGSMGALLPNEEGSCEGVRFISNTNSAIQVAGGTTSNDVHCTLILGADAFGVITPEGVQNIVKPQGAGDDPLNQRSTSGWKAYFTAVILQQLAILRLEHAVSA
jgi:N4-gp56 family major capsid protein